MTAPETAKLKTNGTERPVPSEQFAQGLTTRREVMGDAYVDAALNKATDFTWPMQELVTEYC